MNNFETICCDAFLGALAALTVALTVRVIMDMFE